MSTYALRFANNWRNDFHWLRGVPTQRGFMSDIERGVENVTLQTIAKLSTGLGVKIGDLLSKAGV